MVSFDAIWDTGATNSVITQAVVDACGLVATGIAKVRDAHGERQVETYLVNIGLPNQVNFFAVRVTKGSLYDENIGRNPLRDSDMLIGMDIINSGDFAVTNHNGRTRFSYRYPSIAPIDFVAGSRTPQFQHGGRPKPKRPKHHNPSDRGKRGKKKR